MQARDIEQTRSRPCQKNDQAHVESKNNHVVRKHAFYWRYDTGAELELLNQLWELVSLRPHFFTPPKKIIGYTTTANGRRSRVSDRPATPWQRLQASGVLDTHQLSDLAARIEGINPADLTRQINDIQMQLLDLANRGSMEAGFIGSRPRSAPVVERSRQARVRSVCSSRARHGACGDSTSRSTRRGRTRADQRCASARVGG